MSHEKTIDYDRVSKVYDNVRVGDPEMVHQIIQETKLRRDSLVLDVGCGTGNNTILLAETSQARVIGLDFSFGMLEKAGEKTSHVPLVQAPADKLPFSRDIFKLVFMTEVIHHLPDPESSIKDIFRVLEPNGSICVVTQGHKQIDGRMTSRFFPTSAEIDKKRYPDIDVIEGSMLKAGFTEIELKEYEFKPTKLGKEYLNTVQNRGYSMLHKISREEYERGVKDLEEAFDNDEELTYSAGYTFVWGLK